MTTRIDSIAIAHFRGIPGSVRLDLSQGGNPSSLFLFGENGTGKSSIVDALQFALQPKLARLSGQAQSFATPSESHIEVGFADGTILEAPAAAETNGLDPFGLAPFVLRRSDLLAFLREADASRQQVFVNLLKDASWEGWGHIESPEIPKLAARLKEAHEAAAPRRTDMAEALHCDPGEVPAQLGQFDRWLKRLLNRDLVRAVRQRQRVVLRPPLSAGRVIAAWRTYRGALVAAATAQTALNAELKANRIAFRENVVTAVLHDAASHLSETFLSLSNLDYIKRVVLEAGGETDVSLSLDLELSDGRRVPAGAVLSEAYLDALALLLFLAYVREAAARGQGQLLVLDDVFQSVDSVLRGALLQYLFAEFGSWQLVITSHDRMWHERLIALARAHGHRALNLSIARWSFDSGPVIAGASSAPDAQVRAAIDAGDVIGAAQHSGRLLEEVLGNLSWRLPVAVQRTPDDRYTIAQLLEPIAKKLRPTDASPLVDDVQAHVDLRNLVGAHFNEWANSASLAEVGAFARAVLELYERVRCRDCGGWLERGNGTPPWACRCGRSRIDRAATSSEASMAN